MIRANNLARLAGLFVAVVFLGGLGVRAEEPKEKDKEKDEEAARLEFMTRKIDEFALAPEKEPDKLFTRLKEPIHRYTNPARNAFSYGALFLWVSGERPVAVGTIWIGGEGDVHREFATLTDQPLVCKRGGKDSWTPNGAGFAWKPLPDAPKPDKNPKLRLTQMRQQAERFTADFEIKSVKGKEELQLMPQPLHRYTADKGTVEGAVFALAHNRDPELLVVLELTNLGRDKPTWSYAPVRMSSALMRLRLDNKQVWDVDYYWGNPQALTDPYREGGEGRYPAPEKKP